MAERAVMVEDNGNPEQIKALRVLITGAGSYVGMSLANWLARFSGQYAVDTVDMTDPAWKAADFAGYDSIFHVAGIAHVTADPTKESLYMRVNRDLALEVADKSRKAGVRQFIFMSSAIVYGADRPAGSLDRIDRTTRPTPVDIYGKSKWEAEQGLAAMEEDSFQVAILRSPMIYGPGSRGNFPRLLQLARWCPLFPSVGAQRSMVFIDNLCEFVRLVIDDGASGVFFPQNEQPVDPSEVVREYRRQEGCKTWLIRGLGPLLRFSGRYIGAIHKVFGRMVYDLSISDAPHKAPYRSVGFEESIRRCRQVAGEDRHE